MSERITLQPIAVALGTTFVISLTASPIASAADNPFSMTEYESGYMVAEGKCGDKMKGKAEGKCGEGKCGDKKAEGKCGEAKKTEGKCGDKK